MLKYLLIVIGLMPEIGAAAGFPAQGAGHTSCNSLWVERNQIYNVAGLCFNNALGQAVFDNGDCVPGVPSLSKDALNRIAQLERAELRLECAVETFVERIVINGRYGPIRFGKGGVVLGRWPRALAELDVFPRPANRLRRCIVSGLSDTDEGSLALRAGPDVRYPKTGSLYNGNVVSSVSHCMGRWCFSDQVEIDNRQAPLNGWFHVQWCQP